MALRGLGEILLQAKQLFLRILVLIGGKSSRLMLGNKNNPICSGATGEVHSCSGENARNYQHQEKVRGKAAFCQTIHIDRLGESYTNLQSVFCAAPNSSPTHVSSQPFLFLPTILPLCNNMSRRHYS